MLQAIRPEDQETVTLLEKLFKPPRLPVYLDTIDALLWESGSQVARATIRTEASKKAFFNRCRSAQIFIRKSREVSTLVSQVSADHWRMWM